MNYDLSIIIPASNKDGLFINKTIESLLKNIRANTEIIVVYNGALPEPGIPNNERVVFVYYAPKIGQRAAINQGVRLSRAKYIMKLDNHCDVAEGFDVQLIATAEELGREIMQVPLMYNLHAFDWVCADGHRRYQGPSGVCTECGKETTRDVIWKRRESRRTWAWRFDQDLHFNYWKEYERKHHHEDYVETMSILGACFFLNREWYWELGGCDEEHGSWGQQGTEMSCKAWLSGGRVICNKKTWFGHMFRTQGADFSFSQPISGAEVEIARAHSRKLWKENTWPKAIHDLDWLVEKFSPVPGWADNTPSDNIDVV